MSLLARRWRRWAAMTGPAGVIHRLGWPQKLGVAANLPSIATRAVRALSDQQSARSTSPLGSSEHKLKRGAASLPRFWIERPKAWLLRHTAGTDRILTLPPPDNAPRRINAFFFSASAWRVGGLLRHAACDSSALRGRPRSLFLFDPFWTKMPWCLAGTAQPLT
jgi:hypothetical protein